MKNSVSLSQVFARYFTENEIQAIKDCVIYGSWGDSTVNFIDGDHFGFGYCTNDAKEGGHFSGRQISGLFSSISKKIEKFGINWMAHFPDWWGDGSGDMLFIRCYQNDDDFSGSALYELVEKWAGGSEDPDCSEWFGEEVSEGVSNEGASEMEPLPEIEERLITDPKYSEKYIKKEVIAHKVGEAHEWLLRNGAQNVPDVPGFHEPKAVWLRQYKFLVQAMTLAHDINAANKEEASIPESKAPIAAKSTKAHRGTAQERVDRYTAELEARVAGTLTDLEGRALKKRIASLKRKIARATKGLGLPEVKEA